MILKKPYAFFIKNFKFFHLIITVLAGILLYRTSLIYSFLAEYNKTNPNLIGKNLTQTLFTPWVYVLIVIIIIINILLIVVMKKKDKPYAYYIMNIGLYIAVLVTYILSHEVVHDLQEMLVAARTTLAIRDITNLARLFQTVSVIFFLIRATGFDIKKFDFVRDLQQLDISEEDSEEIEVSLEFEGNVFKRNIKRHLRDAKYYYKENKFIINIIILLCIAVTSLFIYGRTNKYNRTYKENSFFNVSGMNVGIKESFIVAKNYKNETITNDNILVALKVSANSSNLSELPTARTVLVVNGIQYYPTTQYKKELLDLGKTYQNEELENEFNDYLLVYEIPKEVKNSNMIFRYIDNIKYERGKTKINAVDVKLSPISIDEQKEVSTTYNLTEQIDTTKTGFSDYKIQINSFDIADMYIETYNSCVNQECFDFKDIIKPTVETNKEKALMKLEGTLEYTTLINKINNIPRLISQFGTIEYTINGKTYKETNDFNEQVFKKISKDNTYYIEINKEIKEATNIKLIFTMRNQKYIYILRGDQNA